MRVLLVRLITVLCCLWAAEAHSKITIVPPPEVDAMAVYSHDLRELTVWRESLMAGFGATQAVIDKQAAECSNVDPRSSAGRECAEEANGVQAAVIAYRKELAKFKLQLAESADWQNSIMEMDEKTSMSADRNPQSVSVESKGIVHVVADNGEPLPVEAVVDVTEDSGNRFVTGRDGAAILRFPDGSIVRLGPNTTFVLRRTETQRNLADQSPMELVGGTLRWFREAGVDMKKRLMETPTDTRRRHSDEGKIRISGVIMTIRGTEFDCAVQPHGSGVVKLYSGEVSFTLIDGTIVTLAPGQMIDVGGDQSGHVSPIYP